MEGIFRGTIFIFPIGAHLLVILSCEWIQRQAHLFQLSRNHLCIYWCSRWEIIFFSFLPNVGKPVAASLFTVIMCKATHTKHVAILITATLLNRMPLMKGEYLQLWGLEVRIQTSVELWFSVVFSVVLYNCWVWNQAFLFLASLLMKKKMGDQKRLCTQRHIGPGVSTGTEENWATGERYPESELKPRLLSHPLSNAWC